MNAIDQRLIELDNLTLTSRSPKRDPLMHTIRDTLDSLAWEIEAVRSDYLGEPPTKPPNTPQGGGWKRNV